MLEIVLGSCLHEKKLEMMKCNEIQNSFLCVNFGADRKRTEEASYKSDIGIDVQGKRELFPHRQE